MSECVDCGHVLHPADAAWSLICWKCAKEHDRKHDHIREFGQEEMERVICEEGLQENPTRAAGLFEALIGNE